MDEELILKELYALERPGKSEISTLQFVSQHQVTDQQGDNDYEQVDAHLMQRISTKLSGRLSAKVTNKQSQPTESFSLEPS